MDKESVNPGNDNYLELEMLQFALNQSAIVATTDIKGTIISVNSKFCEISKYSHEELIGQNHRLLRSGHHSPEFYYNLWETISSGKVWVGQIKNKAKDGSFYWVHTTIVPFLNDNGNIYQYKSIRFDITKQKELEHLLEEKVSERTNTLTVANKKINEMMEVLMFQNQQLVDFCNIVSHNLRAPLVNMLLLVDFIEKSKDASEQKLFTEKLSPVITSLNETFDHLVESLQIKQDHKIEHEKNTVKDSLQKVLDTLQGEILAGNARIEINTDETPFIYYPSKYLSSILSNLISNALKYSFPDRNPSIKIKTELIDGSIILSVTDNGLGIDMEKHKDQLFKIRRVFHENQNSRGFGLFITKTQIETMGGRIWVESTPNVGSVFFVEFKNQNIWIQ